MQTRHHFFKYIACATLFLLLPACLQHTTRRDGSDDKDGQARPLVRKQQDRDRTHPEGPKQKAMKKRPLRRMAFSIQVGAFAVQENAIRLARTLQDRGVDAFYFRHQDGLYKVRFGNFKRYQTALAQGGRLRDEQLIGRFYVIKPENYSVSRAHTRGRSYLRSEIVSTARRFLGVPYRWGGTSAKRGFDCSGLTMVVYRLNGMRLPRTAAAQHGQGRFVSKNDLGPGDLVFFATGGGSAVTHVGIYIGNGKFIHAPRAGKRVEITKLSHSYFRKRYRGGRTYIDDIPS